jgi:hypothetical protein
MSLDISLLLLVFRIGFLLVVATARAQHLFTVKEEADPAVVVVVITRQAPPE